MKHKIVSRIDPEKELYRWGPIEGRIIYTYPFMQASVVYPRYFNRTWPDSIFYIHDDTIMFVLNDADLRKRGEEVFIKYALNEKRLDKIYNTWLEKTRSIVQFERVSNGIGRLSDEELAKLFARWYDAQIEFWVYGYLPELGNFGGEELLKGKLLNKADFAEIFERLAAPEQLSFFQKEELELLKIRLVKDRKRRERELKSHQRRYYWIRNSYRATKVLGVDFFRKEMLKVTREEAKRKVREIAGYPRKVVNEKKKAIKKYKIDSGTVGIAKTLAYLVWWQDYRKSFIFRINHVTTCFLREISKRKNVDFKELCCYTTPEVIELLGKNKRSNVRERFNGFVEYYHERNGLSFLAGKDAREFMKPYLRVKADLNLKEVKGIVVSSGKSVKGRVKIITSPREANRMNKGDILVAPMTSPDFIVAMRKAGAVVTDEGGMTSHAAIVSRELKIPCIVGTKIATKVFKDNEVVEVDANKGVVRKV